MGKSDKVKVVETVTPVPTEAVDTVTEVADDLQAVSVEEVVLTDETTKTYEFKKEVFVLDDQNLKSRKISYANCGVEFNNPLPVFADNNKQIGTAVLSLVGRSLEADFCIDYSTPERLDIETHNNTFYPHLESYAYTVVEKGTICAIKLTISAIKINRHPTLDNRIQSL